MTRIGPAADLPEGTVTRAGADAVGNNGHYFAVSRRCRHLGAELDKGSIDAEGCLVCPWHGAKYTVTDGRMVLGPQGVFAKVPGLGALVKSLTRVLPLRVRRVVQRGDELFVEDGRAAQ